MPNSYTTRTADLGRVTFTAPAATETRASYVWVQSEHGFASDQRRQICHGGDFTGPTVTACAGPDLIAAARRWMRHRRAAVRADAFA